MARTDDDSWDITEGVGATALGVAWARSQESASSAHCSPTRMRSGSSMPPSILAGGCRRHTWSSESGHLELRRIANQVVRRLLHRRRCTRHRAGGHPCRGADARAWRLPWADDSVVYEIDQPKVLAFKAKTLRRRRTCGPLRRGAHRPPPGLAGSPARRGFRPAGADGVGRRGSVALSARRRPGPVVRTHP